MAEGRWGSDAAPTADFRVLGPLEVRVGGVPRVIGGAKPRALLAILLLEAPRAVSVSRLVDELWGDSPPPTATTALQVHVSALRRAVPERVSTEGGAYALDTGRANLDARRFSDLAAEGRALLASDPAQASAVLSRAERLWRGEAFAGVPPTPIVAAATSRLQEARLAALEDRIEADLARGLHDHVVAELTGLVQRNPTRERLVGFLMLALHRMDRSGDALRVYEDLCQVLDRELGVDPGDAVATLHKAIRRGDPTLVPADPSSLPTPSDRFVGRTREIDDAAQALLRARMLTLVGPGGAGKTRLGLELARRLAPEHPGGVSLVEMASLPPNGSVAARAATALGIGAVQEGQLEESLVAHLRNRRCLLVLDNCEHVVAGAATLCGHLLSHCPGLRVLATSRERLGVAGEVVWSVPPLALPRLGASPEEIAGSDAVQLFLDRGKRARPDLDLETADIGLVAQICRQLEGLPLAIELAAARLRTFSLPELSALLGEGMDSLGRDDVGAESRQRTLRSTIEWSHRLLADPERATFRRFSVLRGGGLLDAVLGICADPELAPPRTSAEVAEALVHLVDRSLVTPIPGPAGTRYRMLEMVREYADERLDDPAERERAAARHALHFSRLVEGLEQALHTNARPELLGALDAEHDNAVGALGWAERSDPAALVELAGAWFPYWWMRSFWSQGRQWLERAIAQETAPGLPRLQVLSGLGRLELAQGNVAAARRLFEEGLALAEGIRDIWSLIVLHNCLGIVSAREGAIDAARAHFLRCLDLGSEHGLDKSRAVALGNLADLDLIGDDYESARRRMAEAIDIYRRTNLLRTAVPALVSLAQLELEAGAISVAVERLREALGVVSPDDRFELAALLETYGFVLAAQDQPVPAVTLGGAASVLYEDLGAQPSDFPFRARTEAKLAAVRDRMGAEAAEEAWTRGAAMSVEDALAYALNLPIAGPH